MKLWIAAGLLLLGLSHSASAEDTVITLVNLAPGQMWSIKSSTPTTAKVIIGRIEPWADRTAVHVSIIDVPVPTCLHIAAQTTTVGHMPFEKSALSASLDKLLSTQAPPAPSFEDGYKQWQAAKGGIFTIDVPQALSIVFACK